VLTVLLVAGALVVIAGSAVALFRALSRAGVERASADDQKAVAALPVAILTERLVVEPIACGRELAELASVVVRADPAVFVASLWPGIDSEDVTDDDHVDADGPLDSDDDNDDLPEEADDEDQDELRRRRDTIATAAATLVGLAARGLVRLAIERIDRVDGSPRLPNSALQGRGLLVRRISDGAFDGEPALELAVLAQLPLATDVPIAKLREVLLAIHLDPPATTAITRTLADRLAGFVADHPEVWVALSAAL
jgi:hypothetical protein